MSQNSGTTVNLTQRKTRQRLNIREHIRERINWNSCNNYKQTLKCKRWPTKKTCEQKHGKTKQWTSIRMKLIAPKTLHKLKLKQKVFNNKHNLQVQWQKICSYTRSFNNNTKNGNLNSEDELAIGLTAMWFTVKLSNLTISHN